MLNSIEPLPAGWCLGLLWAAVCFLGTPSRSWADSHGLAAINWERERERETPMETEWACCLLCIFKTFNRLRTSVKGAGSSKGVHTESEFTELPSSQWNRWHQSWLKWSFVAKDSRRRATRLVTTPPIPTPLWICGCRSVFRPLAQWQPGRLRLPGVQHLHSLHLTHIRLRPNAQTKQRQLIPSML